MIFVYLLFQLLFVCFGKSMPWMTWFISCVHGFFVGPLYPAGEHWSSNLTINV